MSESALLASLHDEAAADRSLKAAAGLWLAVAMTGLLAFVAYVATTYGAPAARGDFAAWGRTSLKGYETGDAVGNAMFAFHVLAAVAMSLSAALQLVPQIRTRAAGFHRWNGRVFLAAAFVAAIGGLHLVWVRHANPTLIGSVGITLDAALILAFGALALREARARRFVAHRRWALRLFMVANGVWFMRLGYMAWVILNHGPVGMTDELDGPFDVTLAFAAFLAPLALAEAYIRVQARAPAPGKYAFAAGLLALSGLTAIGVFGAVAIMWAPRMAQALAAA